MIDFLSECDYRFLRDLSQAQHTREEIPAKTLKRLFGLGLIVESNMENLVPVRLVRGLHEDAVAELKLFEEVGPCCFTDHTILSTMGFITPFDKAGHYEITKSGKYALKQIRRLNK